MVKIQPEPKFFDKFTYNSISRSLDTSKYKRK